VSYTWTVPEGWNITAGQGTNSITVTAGTVAGNITVTPSNTCGDGTARSLAVTAAAIPTAPVVGTITHPTCAVITGSVFLSGLPASGTWTLTRTPGEVITTGTGTSTTVSEIPAGTYTYTATSAAGCISPSSANVIINDMPVITDQNEISVLEDNSLLITTSHLVIEDSDNTPLEMTVIVSNGTNYTVSGGNTITPSLNFNGTLSVPITVNDGLSTSCIFAASITVNPDNDPPVVSDLPNQTIPEGNAFTTIALDNYVQDVDNADNQITWTYTGNVELLVSIVSRVATISAPGSDWNGSETIIFTATDPGLLSDSDPATFTITGVNDPPVVGDIPDQTILEGSSFTTIALDGYVSDPDNLDSEITWTYSGESELLISIFNRIATIEVPDDEWNGNETITFIAMDPDDASDSDPATFTVTAVNDPPVVSDIPNQIVAEGGTFATINLDNYVQDPDNPDNEITWTYSGNIQLLVSINARVATITLPGAEWNGSETITFTATDPGTLFNSDGATFTITPVDDPPVVSDIPNQTIAEGAAFVTITLDNYVQDPDDFDNEMTWTYSGNINLSVTINPTTRVATITPLSVEWNGSETINFRATDPEMLYDSDDVIFTITPVNDAPEVSDIPDQSIAEGGAFAIIPLDDYVADYDNSDSQITWTYSGNSQLSVSINPATREATITPLNTEWNGSETITFRATDPGSLYNLDQAVFTITPVNDAPVVTDIPNQSIAEGGTFVTIPLDHYVHDTDNSDSQMTWTYSGNSQLSVSINPATRVATITPLNVEWNGSETITFRATDPGSLFSSDQATFTVTQVNDAPVVSDIPNQSMAEGGTFVTIPLDNYVHDTDNSDSQMTWTYSGNSQLSVSINPATRVATIIPLNVEWNGSETITFRATDPGGLFSSDQATFTVTPVNDAPVVSDIPDQSIAEGGTFIIIPLDNYVHDTDNLDNQMTWTFSGNSQLTVTINPATRVATIIPLSVEWNGSETITFRATDPGSLFSSDQATFTVTPVNDPPVLSGIETSSLSYFEGSGQLIITNNILASDTDNISFASASVAISSGYISSEDQLAFPGGGSISGSWNSSTGILSLSGLATIQEYRDALRAISYINLDITSPSSNPRIVAFTVFDGLNNSNQVSRSITINSINNPPELSNIEASGLNYNEGSGAVAITSLILATDPDNLNLASASISISSGYAPGEDLLSFTNTNGITGSWDPSTGILSLTGVSSVANYQSALRNTRYTNTNTDNPVLTPRVVSFSVYDSISASNIITRNINVTGVNDPPVLSNLETGAIIFHEEDNQKSITNVLAISDPDNTSLNSAVIAISANYTPSEDMLLFEYQNGISGVWNSVTGTLSLSGSASIAFYEAAVRSIGYINTNNINPGALTRTVSISVNDGNLASNVVTRSIQVIPVNDPPFAQNVTITGNKTILAVLSGNYIYTDPEGNPEGTSEFTWYLSENSSGENKSVIPGATAKQYQIQYNDGGKWIGFEVIPKDILGDTARPGFSSPWYYVNAAPVANNLSITGLIGIDQTVAATFNYSDPEGDPENSTEHIYKWYRANDSDGSGKTLIGSTRNYSILVQDDQKYIGFEITPASSIGTLYGNSVQSEWYGPIGHLPNALISGTESVCPGDAAGLTVQLTTGTPPWSFTYTVNNINPQTVSGISGTRYTLEAYQEGSYKLISVEDASKSGTVSGEAYVIYRAVPTARISGGGTICEGTTASLRVDLTGSQPFMIKYRSNSSISGTVSNIISSPGYFGVKAAGNYTLTEVSDKYCKGTVSGSATVSLIPAPDVEIQGLSNVYSINSNPVPVYGVPLGGSFDGNGLILRNDTLFFLASWAGIENSPHKISYYYQSPVTGCVGKDTIMIDVLEVNADISFPKNQKLFCYNDLPFEVRGLNINNIVGNFSISGGVGMIDNGNNTATINPSELSGGKYRVIYRYFEDTWLEYSEEFEIEYIDPIWFVGFDKNIYCNNESPVMLIGNEENGIFFGNGVIGNINTGFFFKPEFALPQTDTIFYQYTSAHGCKRKVFEVITIKPSPVISFTLADSCISYGTRDSVIFINSTKSSDSIVSWYWDFDDIGTGQGNFSNLENPKHLYTTGGTRYVILSATTDKGCTSTKESRINLGDRPRANFGWNTECFRSDQPILFSNQSLIDFGMLEKFEWRIQSGEDFETYDSENLSYIFMEPGDYNMIYKVESNYGCSDSIMHTFSLKPTIGVADNPYYEDFETGKNGWLKTTNPNEESNSWTFGTSETEFPGILSGAYCWFTRINSGVEEQSWIISPCFDFTDSKKPMIKLNAWRSFDQTRDGAVMQYSDNNQKDWYNVGAIDDGINWYNEYSIQGLPGGQSIGWSSIKDNGWKEMRHSLDSLANKSPVQFRIAYGSYGTFDNNKGFAFDNIWIGEREKVVLVEHFTNSSDSLCKYANGIISDVISNFSKDVIDIQYHTSFPGEDPFNSDNPIVPEVRIFYYGILSVPYTLIDGGISSINRFDYYLKDLEKKDVILQSLSDPILRLNIQTDYQATEVDIEVTMEAINPISLRELTLHIAIIENEISEIEGKNGEKKFLDVVKAFVPDPAGTYIYKEWAAGDFEKLHYTWAYDKVFDVSQLRVVAFIQDENSKEVYQAAIDKFDIVSSFADKQLINPESLFDIIPNPVTDYLQIRFKFPLESDCYMSICSMDGRMVSNDIIHAGTEIYRLDTRSFFQGIYIINLFSDKRMLDTQRILVSY
jgi:hypothetical protein